MQCPQKCGTFHYNQIWEAPLWNPIHLAEFGALRIGNRILFSTDLISKFPRFVLLLPTAVERSRDHWKWVECERKHELWGNFEARSEQLLHVSMHMSDEMSEIDVSLIVTNRQTKLPKLDFWRIESAETSLIDVINWKDRLTIIKKMHSSFLFLRPRALIRPDFNYNVFSKNCFHRQVGNNYINVLWGYGVEFYTS